MSMLADAQGCGQERIVAMKKTIIAILVLSAGRLYAFAPIGPAASSLDKGQFGCGFEYGHTKFDDMPLDFTAEVLGLKTGGTIPMSGDLDTYFARIGYGLSDRFDIFLRLGAAGFDTGDTEFAWGLGGRATIVKSERLDWGLSAQVHWLSSDDEGTIQDETMGPIPYKGDLNLRAIQIAAGPVYKADGFSVYGGPFVYWVKGDGDITLSFEAIPVGTSFDVETDQRFGGYVGLSVDIKDNIAITTEYQYAEHYRAFSFGLLCRF